MRFTIPKLQISIKHFLRACGYIEIQNPHKNNEVSYARSIHPGRFYPRFHIYPVRGRSAENSATATSGRLASNGVYSEQKDAECILDLHMDAKQPSYEGASAHSGEYDSPIVAEEMEKIKINSNKFISTAGEKSGRPIGFKTKKSFWQKIKDLL